MKDSSFIKNAFFPSFPEGEMPQTEDDLERHVLTKRFIPRLPWFYASGVALFLAALFYVGCYFFLRFVVMLLITNKNTDLFSPNLLIHFISLTLALIVQAVLPSFISKDNQLACVVTGWGLAFAIFVGTILFNTILVLT